MSYKPKRNPTPARVNRVYEPFPELANLYYAVEHLCESRPSDRCRELSAVHVAKKIFAAARAAHRAPWQRMEDRNVLQHCIDRLESFEASENAREQEADRVRKLWLPGAN